MQNVAVIRSQIHKLFEIKKRLVKQVAFCETLTIKHLLQAVIAF